MLSVIQLFNGEETRTVGKARTFGGIARLLRSVQGAGEGWGAQVEGTADELHRAGAIELAEDAFDFVVPGSIRRLEIRVPCRVVGK